MFRDSSNGIEEYTTSVIGFINKCIDDVVPTVTVRTYPKQKPWVTGNFHTELKARAVAFKEWDTEPLLLMNASTSQKTALTVDRGQL